jgi:hypothetical protein
MTILYLVAALLVTIAHDVTEVPEGAVRCAQEWLNENRLKDVALGSARIGTGYVEMSMNPWRSLEFMRSDAIVDPTDLAGIRGARFHFPILKADSCFSSMEVHPMGDDQFESLWPMEHTPARLDAIVIAIDRLVAENSHRVWVFDDPWPILCKTVIAERPNGDRIAFGFDFTINEIPNDVTLSALGRPIAEWSRLFKRRLRTMYGFDHSREVSRVVPPAARSEAERALDVKHVHNLVKYVRTQMQRFGVSGEPTLGDPWIYYQLDGVEQLLYANSEAIDPAIFDVDPTFCFPVMAEGETVYTLYVRGWPPSCVAAHGESSSERFRITSAGLNEPGKADWRPNDLMQRGQVGLLELIDGNRWFYIASADSTWVAPYYHAEEGSVSWPQPVSRWAPSQKERILMRYAE